MPHTEALWALPWLEPARSMVGCVWGGGQGVKAALLVDPLRVHTQRHVPPGFHWQPFNTASQTTLNSY